MLYKNEGVQRLEHCRENWPDAYYEETEEEIRRQMLEIVEQEESLQDDNFAIRKQLWELRYGMREKQKTQIDYFIRGIVYLKSVATQIDGFFAKRRCQKILEDAKRDLCIDRYAHEGEAFQQVLQQEWRNLAVYYFRICAEDRNFSTGALGFFKLKDEQVVDKIAEEVTAVAYTVPILMKQEEEFGVWTDVFTKAFYDVFYQGKDILEEKVRRIREHCH